MESLNSKKDIEIANTANPPLISSVRTLLTNEGTTEAQGPPHIPLSFDVSDQGQETFLSKSGNVLCPWSV